MDDARAARWIARGLRTIWTSSGALLLTVGSVLFAVDADPRGVLFWSGVAASLAGVVLSIIHAPQMWRAQESASRSRARAERRAASLVEIMRGSLHVLMDDLGIDSSVSRASIYRHSDTRFVLVARFSTSSRLERPGRTSYPDDEGVIGRAWDTGTANVTDLPEDADEWAAGCVEQFGMDEKTVRSLSMRSRSILGRRIEAPGTTPRPIGVLVLESASPRGVNGGTRDRIIDRATWPLTQKVLVEVLQCLNGDDLPPPSRALTARHVL